MTELAFILIFIVAIIILFDTRKGLLAAIIIRPFIDCFWQLKDIRFGFKPTELNGVLLPIVILIKLLIEKDTKFIRYPFALFWVAYNLYQILPVLIMVAEQGISPGLNLYFRILNGFVGFYIFQEYYNERVYFGRLLLAYIIASVIPLSMSVYQNIMGGHIRTEITVQGLERNIGYYHDSVSMRIYSLQTLSATILYSFYYTKSSQWLKRCFLYFLGLFCIYTIYRLFSKAGYMILAQWAVVWFFLRKQFVLLILIIILGFFAFSSSRFEWIENIEAVYSKETNALKGEERFERTFQGRWYGWLDALDWWFRLPLLSKVIGSGKTGLGSHNDFLRVLLGTGIIGLFLYLILLTWALIQAMRNYMHDSSPLNIMAIMLLGMWLVDSIGLTPGAYPGYQIFVWGFVGLAFRGLNDPEKTGTQDKPQGEE